MKSREITSDQDSVVVKKLGSPIKKTVIDKNTRVDDEDMSRLNDAGPVEKKGLPPREDRQETPAARKVTVVGNHGPDKDGKVDWAKNPDCVDAILQYHEQYDNLDDPEGYLATGERCFRQFNKLFSARVTAQDIADGLAAHNSPSDKPESVGEPSAPSEQAAVVAQPKAAPKEPDKSESFYKIRSKSLPVVTENKVALRGTQFEICKILNCKNICLMQPSKGKPEQNGYFHAACANSDGTTINPIGCPQLEELPEKEQLAFELFKQQFNGNELQAKKFLFLTRKIYGK